MTERTLTQREFFAPRYEGIRGLNFIGHWMSGLAGLTYRESDHGKRFQRENPELDAGLLAEIRNNFDQSRLQTDSRLREKLYRAYQIMHSYGVPTHILID